MARGIANRQKKVVTAKRAWSKAEQARKAYPLPPRERARVRGEQKPGGKAKGRTPIAPSP
jgi:hypothetical protein